MLDFVIKNVKIDQCNNFVIIIIERMRKDQAQSKRDSKQNKNAGESKNEQKERKIQEKSFQIKQSVGQKGIASKIKKERQEQQLSRRSHTEQISLLSARSSEPLPPKIEHKPQPPKDINVQFYLNKLSSLPYGEFIDNMHEKWAHNYERLERDHSFIQWIFPNSFQSRFNSHSRPLSKEQAQEFRTNPQIIKRYIRSYEMMLQFYGFKLKNRKTGELARSRIPHYQQRFYKTLQTSFHNHMRISRILCSLKETGFGVFALELLKALRFQIQNPLGEMKSLQKYNVIKEWTFVEDEPSDTFSISAYFGSSQRPARQVQKKVETKSDEKQEKK